MDNEEKVEVVEEKNGISTKLVVILTIIALVIGGCAGYLLAKKVSEREATTYTLSSIAID